MLLAKAKDLLIYPEWKTNYIHWFKDGLIFCIGCKVFMHPVFTNSVNLCNVKICNMYLAIDRKSVV